MTEQARKTLTSSGKMDWGTPPEVFEPLDAEFHFTLDVCATAENAKCARYFTEEEDGLTQDWDGVCWMNPPYGEFTDKWMRKAMEESRKGATVVCLVASRTGSRRWHKYAMKADAIVYLQGRVKFVGAKSGAPFDSAVVVFRPGAARGIHRGWDYKKEPFPSEVAVFR